MKYSPDEKLLDLGPIADQPPPFNVHNLSTSAEPTVIGHFCGPGGCDEFTDWEWEKVGLELEAVRRNLKPGEGIEIDEHGRFVARPLDADEDT